MVGVQPNGRSFLNGRIDDLEVRGDDAIKELFHRYDTFLFDVSSVTLLLLLASFHSLTGAPPLPKPQCDGVIWHGPAGDQLYANLPLPPPPPGHGC